MFSLAVSTAIPAITDLWFVLGVAISLTPHTAFRADQMRVLTACSYALLIVDTRNITGWHPGGNAYVHSEFGG